VKVFRSHCRLDLRRYSSSNTVMKTTDLCPCGSSLPLSACCGRWHAGEAAPNAEALMRSRYTAFVLSNKNYLLASWHVSTRPPAISFDSKQKWLGLKVVDVQTMGPDAAEVEFIARYRIGGGSAARLHERSRFRKEQGRWYYVDGDML
jgi:SEC-C motif domain protein